MRVHCNFVGKIDRTGFLVEIGMWIRFAFGINICVFILYLFLIRALGDRLWFRLPLQKMKYLVLSFLRSGVEAERGVEFRQS